MSKQIARMTPLTTAAIVTSNHRTVDTKRENQRDNDTDRYELNGSILASRRGGQTNSPGSKPIVQKRPTRLRSPNKAPVPDRPTLRPAPDRASSMQFHATNWNVHAR